MLVDVKTLLSNPLFDSFDEILITQLVDPEKCTFVHYSKGALIVQEGEPCISVGFVVSGILANQQLTPSGEILTIRMFEQNDAFGPALYSLKDPKYPFTLTAEKATDVIYIPFEQIRNMIKVSNLFSENYILFLSTRILDFKNKLKLMQYKDVRSRLIHYLSNEYQLIGETTFELRHSKSAIANMIGVARPSVSRELKHMAEQQIIAMVRQEVSLLKLEMFKCL